MNQLFLLLLVVISTVSVSWSQGVAQSGSDAATERWFDSQTGVENSGLINGQQYKMKIFGAKTNPFFEELEAPGTIHFDHQLYNATVLYDCYQDVVVAKHFSQSGTVWFVQLNKKLVESFSVREHVFRKINDSFYEVLFEASEFQVLAKRSKIQMLVKGINSYVVNDNFFVVHKGHWNRLTSASGLTSVLDNKSDQEKAKSFMKEKKISNRRFSDAELISLAGYVASLQENLRTP